MVRIAKKNGNKLYDQTKEQTVVYSSMEIYTAMEMNEPQTHTSMWMNLTVVSEKNTNCRLQNDIIYIKFKNKPNNTVHHSRDMLYIHSKTIHGNGNHKT